MNDEICNRINYVWSNNQVPPYPSSAMGGAASYPYVRDTVSSILQILSLMQSRIAAQEEEIKSLKEQISKQNQNYMPPDPSLDSPHCDAYDDRFDDPLVEDTLIPDNNDIGYVHPDEFGGSDYP